MTDVIDHANQALSQIRESAPGYYEAMRAQIAINDDTTHEMVTVIPLDVGGLRAIVRPEKIYYYHGNNYRQTSRHPTIPGDELVAQLWDKTLKGGDVNEFVTFIIPGLRGIYRQKMEMLSEDERVALLTALDYEQPADFEYDTFDGVITPYDVVHAPIYEVLLHAMNNQPLEFLLSDIDEHLTITF